MKPQTLDRLLPGGIHVLVFLCGELAPSGFNEGIRQMHRDDKSGV